jgi:1,4-alpha-glucan branching enzyme
VPAWREVLNTDASCFGGSGVTRTAPVKADTEGWQGWAACVRLTLPPLATVWLRPV